MRTTLLICSAAVLPEPKVETPEGPAEPERAEPGLMLVKPAPAEALAVMSVDPPALGTPAAMLVEPEVVLEAAPAQPVAVLEVALAEPEAVLEAAPAQPEAVLEVALAQPVRLVERPAVDPVSAAELETAALLVLEAQSVEPAGLLGLVEAPGPVEPEVPPSCVRPTR